MDFRSRWLGVVGLCSLCACWGGDDASDGADDGTAADGGPAGPDDDDGGTQFPTCPASPSNVGDPLAPVFAAPITTEVVAQPYWVRTGDVTGDGFDDVAMVEFTSGGIFVLPADGEGSFGEVIDLSQSAEEGLAAGLEVMDIDGDGHDDVALGFRLIASSGPGVIKVYWGGPEFPADVTALAGDSLYNAAATVAAGDFDGDGHVDLIGEAAVGMFVSYGTGDRTFTVGQILHEDDLVSLAKYAQAADIDDDGRVEPISSVLSGAGSGFRVYHVGEDRSVKLAQLPSLPFSGPSTYFEDLDLDGAPEMIIAGSAGVYVAWNDGGGGFDAYDADLYCTTTESTMAATSPYIGIADFDGDGELDIAAVEGGDAELVFMLGRAQDRHLRQYARLPAGAYNPGSLFVGDFDGDARPDLAVLHAHTGSLAGSFPLLVHLNETP